MRTSYGGVRASAASACGLRTSCRTLPVSLTDFSLAFALFGTFYVYFSFTGSALKSSASNDASMTMSVGMGVNGFGRT